MEVGKVVIKLVGWFDFNMYWEFCGVYELLICDVVIYVVIVDLLSVDYLDSLVLGMLLMLWDKLGGVNKEVVLMGVCGNVK